MIKQPANISILDPRYGGEIFLNPGGPGVQGVTMLTGRLNDHLVNAINGEDPDGKVFDLVSFDPRGVGFSTPRISCFDDLVARQLWHQLGTAYGDVSSQSFDLLWARARSLEKLCDAGNASLEKALFMSTVSTAFVARDLLAMVEKTGAAREKRAQEAFTTLHGEDEDLVVPKSLQYQPGKELLQYWTSDCVTEGMSEGFWSEINYGIYCTDGLDFRNLSKSDMAAWVATLQQQSPLFGNMFATTSKLPCVGYPARPKWRFWGPFGGKTKTPMLFIGITFDPVAPLEGTRKNVKNFEGARLLQQDSVGHCSINAPSKCTVSYVRKYLVSGELPEEGTICSVDGSPFDENM
ncbi:putative hydrolase [Colletotrichum sp. SAR11_240]|nr:putative hydrolase [Colletotrichum sp. SAR11_240]